MLMCDRYRFKKKCAEKCYAELVLLHPIGFVSHIVHSYAFRARYIDTLFSCSGGTSIDFTKSALGHVMLNLCFCILWDLRVT
jgi:hypothetical protein